MKERKKKKKIPFIYRLVALLLIIVTVFFLGNLIFLNVLSNAYLMLVIFGVLLVDSILLLMLYKTKRKKIGCFFSVLLILIFSLLDFYLGKTTGLLSNLDLNYKTYNYSVLVLKDANYKKLKDISSKKIGYLDNGSEEGNEALKKVMTKVELTSSGYEDSEKLATALMNKKVDAILIENSYLEILNENVSEEDKSFKEITKKIYSFKIVKKISDISKDTNVTKSPFSVYISGIDTYGEISSVSRSDVNMVVTVNPATQQILLTSIPRDYYVKLHGKSGYPDKLTHAGLYGTDMSIQTIEDLLDIKINYYVKVNFSSVVDIVNAIGGVNVYSEYDFTSIDHYHYTKGYNAVNGEEALSFARERKAFATGDRQRIKDQQALLKAIFDKCTSKAIIVKYSKLLDSLSNSFVTNMKMSRLTSLVKMQLSKNYEWNIVTNSLNGSDGKNYTYSAPSTKAYVMIPEESSIQYAHELITKVLNGEKLDKEAVEEGATTANKVTKKDTSSSSNSKNENSNSESSVNNSNDNVKKGLEIKLGKSVVYYDKNKDSSFTYYGYTLSYDGVDVTKSSGVKENFIINGKSYDNYKDLVFYVSKLDKGEYTITYEITYQGYIVKDTQKVEVVEKVVSNSKPNSDNSLDKEEDNNTNDDSNPSKEGDNLESNEEYDNYLEDE